MRLRPSFEAKERRLAALLAEKGRAARDEELAAVVEDAQILGSLELAGLRFAWEDVRSAHDGGPQEILALRRAMRAVPRDASLTVGAIRSWHEALVGAAGFRTAERDRLEAPPAPVAQIPSRLETLEDWLGSPGIGELRPEQLAALACARIVEVLPFDDANGRVARLAASHLMVGGGLPPPILVGADGPYLVAVLRAAFRLDTEPLVSLLLEASSRALDVQIQALERGEV